MKITKLIAILLFYWSIPAFAGECPDADRLKKTFFGDLHVHSSYSLDAYLAGTRNDPESAYEFAKKQRKVGLTPVDENGDPTRFLEIDRPLDFTGVTDHADFFSFMRPAGECDYEGRDCPDGMQNIWQKVQDAANNANDACHFTAFIAYEYTLQAGVSMLHRNVIFENDQVIRTPLSMLNTPYLPKLWEGLKEQCIDQDNGCQVLAIPHNPNMSQGMMFPDLDGPALMLTEKNLKLRAEIEPLVEMVQHKGASECFPEAGGGEEECGFEYTQNDILDMLNPFNTGFSGPVADNFSDDTLANIFPDQNRSARSYVRNTLKKGLSFQTEKGVNPYQLGFIGSTDNHNGTPGYTLESEWLGHIGATDDNTEKLFNDTNIELSPGGLAVVWAEENTRSSIFAGLKNKETYATSGTRMTVRFFGG